MDNQQHPITPPPELVQQWAVYKTGHESPVQLWYNVANQAARWGWQQRDDSVPEELQKARDAELKACCEWLAQETPLPYIEALRAAMRPKPPSLAEQALLAIDTAVADGRISAEIARVTRAALERLQELEKGNG